MEETGVFIPVESQAQGEPLAPVAEFVAEGGGSSRSEALLIGVEGSAFLQEVERVNEDAEVSFPLVGRLEALGPGPTHSLRQALSREQREGDAAPELGAAQAVDIRVENPG